MNSQVSVIALLYCPGIHADELEKKRLEHCIHTIKSSHTLNKTIAITPITNSGQLNHIRHNKMGVVARPPCFAVRLNGGKTNVLPLEQHDTVFDLAHQVHSQPTQHQQAVDASMPLGQVSDVLDMMTLADEPHCSTSSESSSSESSSDELNLPEQPPCEVIPGPLDSSASSSSSSSDVKPKCRCGRRSCKICHPRRAIKTIPFERREKGELTEEDLSASMTIA